MKGRTENGPCTLPLGTKLKNEDEAPLEPPEKSSFSSWLKRPQNDMALFPRNISEKDFDGHNCASPNLSPISTVTLDCDLTMPPDLTFESSMDFLSTITQDGHTGIFRPGIQYQSYNEIYTLPLDDGTSSTFHRTVYIPIRKDSHAGLLQHSDDDVYLDPSLRRAHSPTSLEDQESSQNAERSILPVGGASKSSDGYQETEGDENKKDYCEYLEHTLGDFETTMATT